MAQSCDGRRAGERLGHVKMSVTGREAIELTVDPITVPLVEAARLEIEGPEHRTRAPPRCGHSFGLRQESAPEALAAAELRRPTTHVDDQPAPDPGPPGAAAAWPSAGTTHPAERGVIPLPRIP